MGTTTGLVNRTEVARGLVLGVAPHEPLPAATSSPVTVLRSRLAEALDAGPVVVAFSGGRDSSLVLAHAVDVARREGMDLPVPVSLRFPSTADTDESGWQDSVLDHLGVDEREIVEVSELDADVVGPAAARVHGILGGLSFPTSLHLHLPLLERARGGTLLTGAEGDALLGGWGHAHARHALARPTCCRPRPRAVARLVAPRRLRRHLLERRLASPWLRPNAAAEARAAWAAEQASQPRDAATYVTWWWSRHRRQLTRAAFAALGRAHGVDVVHPLAEGDFASAVASDWGAVGAGGRTATVRTLGDGLLPEPVVRRRTKARFDRALWGPAARRLVDAWDGHGVDHAVVDAEALRRTWSADVPPVRSLPLLQHVAARGWARYAAPRIRDLGHLLAMTGGSGLSCADMDGNAPGQTVDFGEGPTCI